MPEYTNHGRFELALALMAAVTAAVVILRRIGEPPLVAQLFVGALPGPGLCAFSMMRMPSGIWANSAW
jgi:Kef-type K+ transport system membrane component KefB